jgi:prepilin-type N-terminal cleavage/methylation domain-containing protein
MEREKGGKVMRKLRHSQTGFTLVEIAIVIVIIGLLIGGILKGQAMIQNAKVKRVLRQTDELRSAVNTFFDMYGVYPGDEDLREIPPGSDWEGNSDGQIDNNREQYEMFRDLQLAGLISGDFDGSDDLPNHAFGDRVALRWTDPGPGSAKHYFVLYNLPAEVCLEIDVKYDDGEFDEGSIVANADYTPGNTVSYFYMLF